MVRNASNGHASYDNVDIVVELRASVIIHDRPHRWSCTRAVWAWMLLARCIDKRTAHDDVAGEDCWMKMRDRRCWCSGTVYVHDGTQTTQPVHPLQKNNSATQRVRPTCYVGDEYLERLFAFHVTTSYIGHSIIPKWVVYNKQQQHLLLSKRSENREKHCIVILLHIRLI